MIEQLSTPFVLEHGVLPALGIQWVSLCCSGAASRPAGSTLGPAPAQRTMARLSKGLWGPDPALVTALGLLPAL